MDLFEAIATRRSVKRYLPGPVARQDIEALLDAAVLAPNHRMTQPWGFLVLGEGGKRAYAEVLAGRKTRRIEDPAAAETVRERVVRDTASVPVIIVMTMDLAEDPEIREEDYSATSMAIQNLLLAATARGLGTHIKSGAVMEDPALRDALGVGAGQRIVSLIFLGEPAELPPARPRTPAAEKTRWID